MRWSERRTAVRCTFEMTLTLQHQATRTLVRRLVYAANYLAGLDKLLAALHILHSPSYGAVLGDQQLHAQVQLLIVSFHSSMSLVVFGIDLVLLGYLVFKSGYIPWILGIVLAVVGVAWIVDSLRGYLFPHAPLGFLPMIAFGELLFPLWLLIRGWRIRDPGIGSA
jgi:Domain of unknown function (DUF4386)